MTPLRLVLLLLSAALPARAESFLEATVTAIPSNATALVFVVDTMTRDEGPGYDDGAPPPAPADPAAPPAAPRRRRLPAAKPPPPVRTELQLSAPTATVVWRASVPIAENVRLRVIAVAGDATFPVVIASGKVAGLKTVADQITPIAITLAPPVLKLATNARATVATGATFTLAGVVVDPGSFLGTKNRMRIWLSSGSPPAVDRAGTQISTVDVTTTAEEVAFAFELTAPAEPGLLYFQIGETAGDFARADGSQAPFLVVPAVSVGPVPHLKIERRATAALAGEK